MANKGESSSADPEPGRLQLSTRGKEAVIQPHNSSDPTAAAAAGIHENAANPADQPAPVFDQNGEVLTLMPHSAEARAGAFLKDWMRRLNRM